FHPTTPPTCLPTLPYTTLFRSAPGVRRAPAPSAPAPASAGRATRGDRDLRRAGGGTVVRARAHGAGSDRRDRAQARCEHPRPARSEEHASELQSPDHLVCRLLL